ncbi:MAG: SBBP repeat-containing protein, partial [Nitrospirae bacterium]|nr:SBBP repeat-containing protein [Nitrospirota bacterium]
MGFLMLGCNLFWLSDPSGVEPAVSKDPAGGRAGEVSAKARVVEALGRLPLAFIENRGQMDGRVRYYVRTGRQTLWFTEEGAVFDLQRKKPGVSSQEPGEKGRGVERLVFRQQLVGARKGARIEAKGVLPGTHHFFLGNDPAKWRTGVSAYSEVYYREVYSGIDLKLYGNGRALEEEFIVKPGADPGQIRVAYKGIEKLRVAEDGSLRILTAFGEIRESRPRIYQEIEGKRVEVAGRFKLLEETTYAFEVSTYNSRYALLIDPTLTYSTYLGGTYWDVGDGIAVDSAGNAYVTGQTSSANFPTTPGVYDASLGGG